MTGRQVFCRDEEKVALRLLRGNNRSNRFGVVTWYVIDFRPAISAAA